MIESMKLSYNEDSQLNNLNPYFNLVRFNLSKLFSQMSRLLKSESAILRLLKFVMPPNLLLFTYSSRLYKQS
jgi:hypothetical protein